MRRGREGKARVGKGRVERKGREGMKSRGKKEGRERGEKKKSVCDEGVEWWR